MRDEQWAVILGGSAGLGLATAKKLAAEGYNLLIVHRDRKSNMPRLAIEFGQIRSLGIQLHSFNTDATNSEKRAELIREFARILAQDKKLKVLVHSIAKGNLKPMKAGKGPGLNHQDFSITLNAMALSLYDWTKDLLENQLFAKDARVISFTSEGSSKVLPGYAAVSAAKATLEAITRSIAVEFAPIGLKANCIQAGATETAAFKMIPHSEKIAEAALKRNPSGRLTLPEDVANAVYLLCREEAKWITGTVIKVDGGESLR